MLIYLDTCCLQRPLDDRSQPRINIEAEAILTILGIIKSGYVKLVSSEVLIEEISRIPDVSRKIEVEETLDLAGEFIAVNYEIEYLAKEFLSYGIKPMDALHLACAEKYSVDCFCTSDDSFLKKARAIPSLNIQTTLPLELLMKVMQ